MYSEKKLSKPTDKLVSISGLANDFQKLLPDDIYFTGMWWSTFPLCLRWKFRGRPIQEDLTKAPSWCWASIDREVKLNTRVFPQSSISRPSTSEHSDSEWSGSGPSNSLGMTSNVVTPMLENSHALEHRSGVVKNAYIRAWVGGKAMQ